MIGSVIAEKSLLKDQRFIYKMIDIYINIYVTLIFNGKILNIYRSDLYEILTFILL